MRALFLAIWLGGFALTPALAANAWTGDAPAHGSVAQSAPQAQSQPLVAPTPIDVKLAESIIYYYVHKDVSTIPALFEALKSSDTMARSGVSRAAMAGFLSMVFVQNRSRVEGWLGNGSYPGDSKAVLEFSLWQSGNADLIEAIFHERPDFIATKPGNLFSLTPRSALEMDLKWGAFYATGNAGFVSAMVDALDQSRALTGSRELDAAIRQGSLVGLGVNMREHEMIMRLIQQRAADATGDYQQILNSMLATRMAEIKATPDHDGEFSGEIETVKLPQSSGSIPTQTLAVGDTNPTTARRDDTIGVTLLFSGMQLAPDLSADVTYDIKVTGPDGSVDSHSIQTNAIALREKVPSRFNVLESRSTLSIHFEPTDKAGPYRVDITLRDNVGKRSIALSRSVELVDSR